MQGTPKKLTLPGRPGLSSPAELLCARDPRGEAGGSLGGWDGGVHPDLSL